MIEPAAMPESVRELIGRSVHSIEALEVLLLLRASLTRSWTAEQLARDLRLPEAMVVTALQSLVVHRLALQIGEQSPLRYQYRRQGQESEKTIDELSELYAQNRVEVLMQISSNAIDRVRKAALRTFSDAFRLPGRKKDG